MVVSVVKLFLAEMVATTLLVCMTFCCIATVFVTETIQATLYASFPEQMQKGRCIMICIVADVTTKEVDQWQLRPQTGRRTNCIR